MRAVWFAVAAVLVVTSSTVAVEPARSPVVPGPDNGPMLPGGTEVSRPLTPVELPPAPPIPAEPVPEQPSPVTRVEEVCQPKCVRRGPLGPAWDDLEFLLWWPKAHPLPPLVTATQTRVTRALPPARLPVLGDPETVLLVGGRAIDNQDIAGGRFTLGWSLNEAQTFGFELRYFFLGTRTLRARINDFGNPPPGSPRIRTLGLPYLDAVTGEEAVFSLAFPGRSNGEVYAATTTRVQGAEANFVANLHDGQNLKLNGLVGYRYFQVHEGLSIAQVRYGGTDVSTIYDQFDAHNRFNGGQLGLHADISRGIVFCELTGKIAFGETFEVVRIDGQSVVRSPGAFTISERVLPGGLYALPTNMGRYTSSVFAVVPEGTVKVGLRLGDCGRVYVGYNFLYLSDAVRPGDQIDRSLNTAQIPTVNPSGSFGPPDSPRPLVTRSDFWLQGLIIGLETRY
jgi:hypothetical protein